MLTKDQYRSSWYRNLSQRDKDLVNAKAYNRSLEARATSKMAKQRATRKKLTKNLTALQRAQLWDKEQHGSATTSSPEPARPAVLVNSATYERSIVTADRQQAEPSPVLRRRFQPRTVRSDPPDQLTMEQDDDFSLVDEFVEPAATPVSRLIDPPTRELFSTPRQVSEAQPSQPQPQPLSSHQRIYPHPIWSQRFSAGCCLAQAFIACIVGPNQALGGLLLLLTYGAVQSMWEKPHRVAADIHQYLSERPNEAIPRKTICEMFPCHSYRLCTVQRWHDDDGVELWQWKEHDN